MPPVQKHDSQYLNNKIHLDKLMGEEKPPFDWVVTVSFYCAVHLVEKELARNEKHPTDHRERFKFMNEKMTLDSIADVYKALYNESRTSRYTCTNISENRARSALKYLQKIEAELA